VTERLPKFRCRHCGHEDSVVVKGWPDPLGYVRRRRCTQCGETFKTLETDDDPSAILPRLDMASSPYTSS
jgi:transcriptional regulator NrdR family protein